MWVYSILAVARRGGFRDKALLGVWIVIEHMLAIGVGNKLASAIQVHRDHIA